MLFHATHKHSYQTCHAHDEERKAKIMQAVQASDEIGIKIHGIYVDPPGHVGYFVLEADTMEQVVQFFDPMLELGDTDIHPVMSMQAALDALKQSAIAIENIASTLKSLEPEKVYDELSNLKNLHKKNFF